MREIDGIEAVIRDTGYRSSYVEGVADAYIACLEAATRPGFDKVASQTYFENRGKLMLNAKLIVRLLHTDRGLEDTLLLPKIYESVLDQLDTVIEALSPDIESGWGTVSLCPVEPRGDAARLAYMDYKQRLEAYWPTNNPTVIPIVA